MRKLKPVYHCTILLSLLGGICPQRERRHKRKHHPETRIRSLWAFKCCLVYPSVIQVEKSRAGSI